MSTAQANCPACGAPVTFEISSSLVVVCPSCRSIVARTDRGLESLGKVAELSESRSPLKIGLHGQFRGLPFRLTGRAQIHHAAGGVWDEWYAAFGDGRWGWLAEAMGRFFLTFVTKVPGKLPPFAELTIGQRVAQVKGAYLMVAEKGVGEYAGAEGEIPFRLAPGERYAYADLASDRGIFATLDYSDEPPTLYLGQEVTLPELGFGQAALRTPEARTVGAVKVACPHCAGPLELRAPDQTQRVICPYCNSALDANQGNLVFLKTLSAKKCEPLLKLGASAEFEGVPLTVIGFVTRSCQIEETWYPWEEYLLYNPRVGYRWLVRSDGHWTYVKALGAGDVREAGMEAYYQGNRFKCFQRAPAKVDYVIGEFYWKVEAGEQADTADFVRAPYMLSQEIVRYAARPHAKGEPGKADASLGEVSWSLAEYVPFREIERKFQLSDLARPGTVGPCQPFPHKPVYSFWWKLTLAALVLFALAWVLSPRDLVFEQKFEFPPVEAPKDSQILFADPAKLDLKAHRNIVVKATAGTHYGWVFLKGDFSRPDSPTPLAFTVPVEHYPDGEGSPSGEVYLPAPEPGSYTLRLEASWSDKEKPLPLQVEVRQGVPDYSYMWLLLGGLALLPVLVLCRHAIFESSRWSESMYSGGAGGSGGGDSGGSDGGDSGGSDDD